MKGWTRMNVEKIKPVNLQPFLPGLLLSFIVAAVAKVLALWLPQLGGATLAILLGIVLGNTFFNHEICRKSAFRIFGCIARIYGYLSNDQ